MRMNLIKSILMGIERWLYRGHGGCKKCRRPFIRNPPHVTRYNETDGCFPLCETCWQSLIPVRRLPYYLQLWEEWRIIDPDISWVTIQDACLNEDKP